MPKLRCKCPGCQKVLQFEDERTHALRVSCPECQRTFTIPAAKETQVAAAAQSSVAEQLQPDNPLDDLFAQLPSPQSGSGQRGHAPHTSLGVNQPGFATYYTPPRSHKKLSAKMKMRIVATVGIAGGTLALLMVGLFIAIALLKRSGVGELLQSSAGGVSSLLSLDSREAVLRDLESECRRLETIGRAIPKGDQSQETAETLLEGRPALVALFRRACQLTSVRAKLADAVPGANGGLPQRSAEIHLDPSAIFWRIDASRKQEDNVTDAINQLTSLRIAVELVATVGVLELPSPLEVKAEEFQWTDENKRVLAALHLQGRFLRDFTRALARIEPDAVNPESVKPLHEVIDQYSEAARTLAETSRQMLERAGLPSRRIIVEEPKRTAYHRQSASMFSALVRLQNEFKQARENPQFAFVMEEGDKLSQDIADLAFGSDPHALFVTQQTSLDRYQVLAAKRQAEADQLAEVAAKQAREAEEKQRLAEARRREEEAKREQASAEPAAASANPPIADRPTLPDPRGFAGPRTGPRRFDRPGPRFGADANSSRMDTRPPPTRPTPNRSPAEPQATVTIRIRSQSSFDSNHIVKELAAATGARSYQSSQTNNQATLRVTDDGDLNRFVEAIDFGTVENVDEQNRVITVTIP